MLLGWFHNIQERHESLPKPPPFAARGARGLGKAGAPFRVPSRSWGIAGGAAWLGDRQCPPSIASWLSFTPFGVQAAHCAWAHCGMWQGECGDSCCCPQPGWGHPGVGENCGVLLVPVLPGKALSSLFYLLEDGDAWVEDGHAWVENGGMWTILQSSQEFLHAYKSSWRLVGHRTCK